MSSNVFFHAFCAGCGTEVADNGASITFSCDSCKSVTKEPDTRIEIVISNPVVVVVVDAAVSVVTDDEEWEEKQRGVRALDDIEEAKRNGNWTGYDEDDHYMCQCDRCAGYGDEDGDDYGDDGYGLDWNESGYFD